MTFYECILKNGKVIWLHDNNARIGKYIDDSPVVIISKSMEAVALMKYLEGKLGERINPVVC